MSAKAVFPYLLRTQHNGDMYAPFVPIRLQLTTQSLQIHALVDSGSSVNVLPYSIGLQLGADWNAQQVRLALGGNLANVVAKGLLLTASIGIFKPVRLAFAWTQTDQSPVILGQMNFFQEFDICFLRADLRLELMPRNQ